MERTTAMSVTKKARSTWTFGWDPLLLPTSADSFIRWSTVKSPDHCPLQLLSWILRPPIPCRPSLSWTCPSLPILVRHAINHLSLDLYAYFCSGCFVATTPCVDSWAPPGGNSCNLQNSGYSGPYTCAALAALFGISESQFQQCNGFTNAQCSKPLDPTITFCQGGSCGG